MIRKEIKYSIIIPTLNEEENIGKLLESLRIKSEYFKKNAEIIIIDGESNDNTIEICNKYGVAVKVSERGRGNQLIEGAKYARGNYLIFLHADLIPPIDFFDYLDRNIDDNFKIATFRMKLDVNKLLYKLYSFFTRFDSIFSTFGDQGLVVSKVFYGKIGGFKNIPIMEDVDFFKRVRKIEKIRKFDKNIIVSSRMFKKEGVVKTQIKSAVFIIKYLLGADPELLYKLYYKRIDEYQKSNYRFYKISGIRKSQNKIGFNNK